jgi:integrase
LILWAIVARGVSLSSLATEDAVAYRAFLRQPSPRQRWVGSASPRSSAEWRPFAGGLSTRSRSYALSVLSAMFRWLIEQRNVLANPFAGIKVRGARQATLDTTRAFSEGEWKLLRTVADGLEWSYGWQPAAAQRLRFLLDFTYSTGLRAGTSLFARRWGPLKWTRMATTGCTWSGRAARSCCPEWPVGRSIDTWRSEACP